MKKILEDILQNTSIKFLKREQWAEYQNIVELGSLCTKAITSKENINYTINGWALYSSDYYSNLQKAYKFLDKTGKLFDYDALEEFLNIFVLSYKLEQHSNKVDISDLYFFSSFQFPYRDLSYFSGAMLDLITLYMNLPLRNNYAKQYRIGMLRRFFMLKKSIESLASIYDLKRIDQLTEDESFSLDINLNFLYLNLLAIFDCLAFILQFELNIIEQFNINEVQQWRKISLFGKEFFKNPLIREKLLCFSSWEKEIKKIRHSVAHRLPCNYTPVLFPEELAEREQLLRKQLQFSQSLYDECRPDIEKIRLAAKTGSLEKWAKMQEEFDKKLNEKEMRNIEEHKKIYQLGCFSGIFINDILQSPKHHIARILLDLNKFFVVVNIIANSFFVQIKK